MREFNWSANGTDRNTTDATTRAGDELQAAMHDVARDLLDAMESAQRGFGLQEAMCAAVRDLLAALRESQSAADDARARLAWLTATMDEHPQATCADVLDWYAREFVWGVVPRA